MSFISFIEVLEKAAPGQGVMTLTEAWQTYLRQRAVLWLEGVLTLRTWLMDDEVLKRCKCAKRRVPDLHVKNEILSARKEAPAGASPRTAGLAQEIVKGVRCVDILWRTHSYGEADLRATYLNFCWPELDWDLLDAFILFKRTDCALGGYSAMPVNDSIKCLSTAAALGRLPTCASNCLQLTKAELEILSNRCETSSSCQNLTAPSQHKSRPLKCSPCSHHLSEFY